MEMKLGKRQFVRLVSFTTAAFLVVGGLFYQSMRSRQRLLWYLEQTHAKSLSEVSSGLTAVCQSLEQMRYVENGPQLWNLSAQLLRESAAAKQALLSLPLDNGQLEGAGRFLSQSGSFALAMSRAAGDGAGVQAAHRQSLSSLLDYGAALRDAMSDAVTTQDATEITHRTASMLEPPAQLLGADTEPQTDPQGLYAAFTAYDEDATDYPSLVYDGPFSDHMSNRQPTMTANADPITQEKAAELAAAFTHTSPEALVPEGITQSNLPAYRFSGNDLTVEISVNGGYLTQLRHDRAVGQLGVDAQNAKLRAEQFLEGIGLANLQIVFTQQRNGLRLFHYVPLTEEGVLCYPDVVKVGIAADNGMVLFYDGREYLMNHTSRTIPPAYLDAEAAAADLSPYLELQTQHLAWIPTDGANERFCWELRCLDKDSAQQVWVYRNAVTGYEEDVQVIAAH